MKFKKKTTNVLFYSKWDSLELWQKVFIKRNVKLLDWASDFKNEKDRLKIHYAILWDPPNSLFRDFPNLKFIQSLGAGVDHILLKNFPKDCTIAKLQDPDLAKQMTEYTILAVLMCYKNYFQYNKFKLIKKWRQLSALKKEEFTITVLGYGNISKSIVKELVRLGFKVTIWANKKRTLKQCHYYYGKNQLKDSIIGSNCILNLLPSTIYTSELINLSLFKLLNKNSFFINIGRGTTVNEKDLIYALKNKLLKGAVLDVFKNEPLNKSSELWNLENVFISPHIAGITNATEHAATIFINNINSLINNKKIKNKISLKKQY